MDSIKGQNFNFYVRCLFSMNLILKDFWAPKSHLSMFFQVREIPDHATFRGKGANTVLLDKLGPLPSLALCNKANFGYLPFPREHFHVMNQYSVLYKM